jgi:alanine-alpha-ketoisovalerate/valine-pyruvate aminotransferase
LRMTFTMDESTVRAGVQAIGEEVRSAWARG